MSCEAFASATSSNKNLLSSRLKCVYQFLDFTILLTSPSKFVGSSSAGSDRLRKEVSLLLSFVLRAIASSNAFSADSTAAHRAWNWY